MKRRKFKIKAIGYKNEIVEVDSTDYDVENGLIRFKTAVYDIRTGLWVCTLERLKNGVIGNDIKATKPEPTLRMTNMIKVMVEDEMVMKKINQRRETCKGIPTLNEIEVERTLFN